MKCQCCDGRGTVEDLSGKTRPCSRCSAAEFITWADTRRPTPSEDQKRDAP